MKMYGNNFLAQYFSLFSRIIRFYSLLLTKRAFVNPFLYILLCASAYFFSSLPLLFLHARLYSVLLSTLNHYEKCSQSTKLSSLSFMIPRQHASNLCVLMLSLLFVAFYLMCWKKSEIKLFFLCLLKALLWNLAKLTHTHTSHARSKRIKDFKSQLFWKHHHIKLWWD